MASGSALHSKLRDDFLTCPICCSQYVEPKVLKCQHSFCSRCLKGCMKAGSFRKRQVKCAVCRKTTPLTKKGISDMPNNFVVIGLMQMLKDHKKEGPSKSSKEESAAKSKSGKSKADDDLTKVVKQAVKKGKAIDKNANKRKGKVEDTDSDETSDSSESDSEETSSVDEFTPSDDSSSEEDSSSSVDDSNESEDSSGDDEDEEEEVAPPTPTLKSSQGIKKGMKICVFNEKGKPFEATVRVLERFKRKSPGQSRVYAGIELLKENARLNTPDLDDMEDSYLYNWLMDYDFPCAVVRVDQCCPSRLLSDLLPFAK